MRIRKRVRIVWRRLARLYPVARLISGGRWIAIQFKAVATLFLGVLALGQPSMRRLVSGLLRRHFRKNPTIRPLRYRWGRKLLAVLRRHRLLSIALLFCCYGATAWAFGVFAADWLAALEKSDHQDIVIGLLAAQAALFALVFPLIIALLQLYELRTVAGGSLTILLTETEAFATASSSLTLCGVLGFQLLLFSHVQKPHAAALITADVAWFCGNVALLGFFLMRTLDFIRPVHRATLIARYLVNVSWREQLRDVLALDHVLNAQRYGHLPAQRDDTLAPQVLVSPMLTTVPAAVTINLEEDSLLHNLRLPVLRVVVNAWSRRAAPGSSLVFQSIPAMTCRGEEI